MPALGVATRSSRPPIRVRPAPRWDPPYDDELDPDAWVSVHQLALQFPPLPTRTEDGGPSADPAGAAPGGPRLAGASDDAALAVRRFVRIFLEVLNGFRPAAHLRSLSLPREAPSVVTQAIAATGRVAELRRARAGRRVTDRRDRGATPVATIGTHLCEPRPGAVEASVLLVTGDRTWAMALRLERHDQVWCATALRMV